MRLQILAVWLVLVPAVPALAQIGNPAFMAPDTRFEAPGVQAPNQTNTPDRVFAQLVKEGGMAEVTFGRLAAEKGQAEAVGGFARRMVDDHAAANEKLAAIAAKSKIPLPEELNEEHAAMLERLRGLDGADFDLAYMRGQVVDHQKTVQLLAWEITAGQDPELKAFAAEALPTVLRHIEMARAIVTELALQASR